MVKSETSSKAAASIASIEKPEAIEPPRSSQRGLGRAWRIIIISSVVSAVVIVGLALGLGLGLGLKHGEDADDSSFSSAPTPMPTTSSAPTHNATGNYSGPPLTVGTTWDYPLGMNLTIGNANFSLHFYTVDLFNTPTDQIAGLIAQGHYVACYFSAGSREPNRPDSNNFPSSVVGNQMKGWPDENWLDTTSQAVRNIMQNRISLAAQKGCQGIDADNIDGYELENNVGFNISQAQGVDFVTFLAHETHAAGMAYGLKNGGAIVPDVVQIADWDVQEQCVATAECEQYEPFISAGKPVFHVEYTDDSAATSVDPQDLQSFCAAGSQKGFSTIVKHMSLDNWVVTCS